ncbi:hypothetical protein HY478_03915 [Candidatus Uhrbacteria bacterium]|nr:hypothetical protein [Candidatus Uhrbacteria bacterium]
MRRLSIKMYMSMYLAALLAVGAIVQRQPMRMVMGILIVALYVAGDCLWTYAKKKIWYVPTSSVISALIIALVFDTIGHSHIALLVPLIAVATKHLLHFGRIRHLINPAAGALVVISFFVPVVSWWGVAWGAPAQILIALSGLYILYRLRRFHVVGAFLLTYLVLLVLVSFARGIDARMLPALIFGTVRDGTLLFFMTVMLIEPVTTAYPRPRDRIMYGGLVGLLVIGISLVGQYPPLGAMDPLLLALVVGTMVMGLRVVPKKVALARRERAI